MNDKFYTEPGLAIAKIAVGKSEGVDSDGNKISGLNVECVNGDKKTLDTWSGSAVYGDLIKETGAQLSSAFFEGEIEFDGKSPLTPMCRDNTERTK